MLKKTYIKTLMERRVPNIIGRRFPEVIIIKYFPLESCTLQNLNLINISKQV
jgi:hypothetical protein